MKGATSTEMRQVSTSAVRMPASSRATRKPVTISAQRWSCSPCSGHGGSRTSTSDTRTATKLAALQKNAVASPPAAIASAASDGPMMRPRLYCAELRLSAERRSSAGTSSASSDEYTGDDQRVHAAGEEGQHRHRGHRQPSGEGEHRQRDGEQRLRRGQDGQEPPPVDAVGQRAGHRPQHQRGQVHQRGHRARPAGAAGGLGDVDAHPDGLHPRADVGDERAQPEADEVRMAKGAKRGQPVLPLARGASDGEIQGG